MTIKKQVTLFLFAIFLLTAAYVGSAICFVKSTKEALFNKNVDYIADHFDWVNIAADIENQTKYTFVDPSSWSLGRIAGATFKERFLQNTARYSIIVESGFSNIDEYTLITNEKIKLKINRNGFKWVVKNVTLTQEATKAGAIEAMRQSFGKLAEFNVHEGNIYFGSPLLGCVLTKTGDVGYVTSSTTGVTTKVAYSRKITRDEQKSFNRIYVFDTQTPSHHELMIDEEKYDTKENPSENIAPLGFSLDARELYFYAGRWATSGAIDAVDLKTKVTRHIAGGNGFYLVRTGEFKGSFVTSQHRYYDKGGSYDWAYIISPKGEVLGNSGQDVDLKDFLKAVEQIKTTPKNGKN